MKIQYVETSLVIAAIGAIVWPINALHNYMTEEHKPSSYPRISSYVMRPISRVHPAIDEQGLQVSDTYARLQGAKDWNDYVLNVRPKNKMGKLEKDNEPVRRYAVTKQESPTTFPIVGSEEQYNQDVVEYNSSSGMDAGSDPWGDVVRTNYPIDTTIASVCPECCRTTGTGIESTSTPAPKPPALISTNVDEPSILALLLVGALGIFVSRRKVK